MPDYTEFQLEQLAAEVQAILSGAVRFDKETGLSETAQAQARSNIGASPFGSGIKIISHFDTLAELEAAVKSPNAGDAYSVGTTLPYNLYIYDYLYSVWRDYGAIRSTDISARFAQNVSVDVSAWKEDTDVFADYTYKAQISLGEVNSSDFPIVAFSPSDAVSGNFCPIAYCFDGYVEVWARAIPDSAISIPAITFIVQSDGASGGSTKGITNASGGIATGGVTNAMLANGAVTNVKISNAAVTRAKLANDALYSPFVSISQSTTIDSTHIGKKLRLLNANADIDINVVADASIPFGAEIAIFNNFAKTNRIVFAANTSVAIAGASGYIVAPELTIPENFDTIALEKITSEGGYDYWHVIGNVEVVT